MSKIPTLKNGKYINQNLQARKSSLWARFLATFHSLTRHVFEEVTLSSFSFDILIFDVLTFYISSVGLTEP